MEGKTHYVGGSIGAVVGFIVLKENGMLLDNVSPLVQFGILYPFGIYGGMLPDADHHPESSPLKDPVGKVFNRVLHVFNPLYKRMDELLGEGRKSKSVLFKLLSILKCTHRSWQTHSELTLAFLVYILFKLSGLGLANANVQSATLWGIHINEPSLTIVTLMVMGLTIGILSHLILDMFTSEGINFAIGVFIKTFFPKVPMITTLRFVPNWHTFTTGSPYELTVRSVLNVVQFFILGYCVLVLFGYTLTMA
jgi:hypothetical protein